ncbi:MAG TPA: protein kinase [Gemmatales bacterium]|nr:protein kinase [Gemmatales bacterium]
MPANPKLQDFWQLVWKSGLVEAKSLLSYGQQLSKDPLGPTTPEEFARRLVRDGLVTRLQAEFLLKGRARGFMLDKYRLLERLGKGGTGSVYLAAHIPMRRLVAIKVLPAAQLKDKATLERFLREARAIAALDHPHLVHAYDAGQEGTKHFLVMEYVDGSSLQDVVSKGKPLPTARALAYLRQAALGLQHIHENGLIHRDVKPANLLLDRRGHVKVLDLGLALFSGNTRDNLTRDLEAGGGLGTVDYISPEQAMDTHTADVRSDVYSLGFTGYFLLTGQPPFNTGTVAQKLVAHQMRDPAPLRELRPEIKKEVAAVLAKMYAKRSEDRFQSAREVAEALRPFVPATLPPPSEKEMPQLCLAALGKGMANPFQPIDAGAASSPVPPLWSEAKGLPLPAAEPFGAAPESAGAPAPLTRRHREPTSGARTMRHRPPRSAAKSSARQKKLTQWIAGGLVVCTFAAIGIVILSSPGGGTGAEGGQATAAHLNVRPESDGSIILSARTATRHGSLRYEHDGENIGYWTAADDYVSWEFEAPSAQTFEVVLHWSCEGDGGETKCAFQIADAKLPFTVEGTGTWHNYQSAKLGTLRATSGKNQAALRVTSKPNPEHAAMNLRSIALVPVKP